MKEREAVHQSKLKVDYSLYLPPPPFFVYIIIITSIILIPAEVGKKDKLDIDHTSSDGNDEEKYRDRGSSASGRHKIVCEEPDGPTHSSPTDSQHQQRHKTVQLRTGSSGRRPVSFTPSEGGTGAAIAVPDKRASLYSSGGSDMSVPVSPYHRRHATGAGSLTSSLTGSQTGERPRVSWCMLE